MTNTKPLHSCTIFSIASDDAVWAGNNEDWKNNNTYIWFVPGSEDKYGAVYFGFNNGYPQGGMNEKGLFFDWAALSPRKGFFFGPEKPMFDKIINIEIMEKCETVDEAIQYFRTYHYAPLKSAHILVSDQNGDSAIVELGKDGLEIIQKDKEYQIITNFYNTDPSFSINESCKRYEDAEDSLKNIELTEMNLRSVLQNTQQYGPYPTQYSYILNLKEQKIFLFDSHDYETPVIFDLHEELKSGKHAYKISGLFEINKDKISSNKKEEFIFLNLYQPTTIKAYESLLFLTNRYHKIRAMKVK